MRYFLISISLMILCSCGKSYEFNQSFEKDCWVFSKPCQFQIPVKQANAKLQYELQYTDAYDFQNINLQLHIKSPSGKTKDTLIIDTLMSGLGTWRGEFSSGKHHVPFKKIFSLPFTETGNYEVKVSHSMRTDTLCGVAKLGIDIKP